MLAWVVKDVIFLVETRNLKSFFVSYVHYWYCLLMMKNFKNKKERGT